MVFQCINIRQVPLEVLKTAAFGLGFQDLPRDVASVNAWKTMFDPYNIALKKSNARRCDVRVLCKKQVICKSWTWTLASSADPEQTLQNMSDQDVHCLLKLWKLRLNETVWSPRSGPFVHYTLRNNWPPVLSVFWWKLDLQLYWPKGTSFLKWTILAMVLLSFQTTTMQPVK